MLLRENTLRMLTILASRFANYYFRKIQEGGARSARCFIPPRALCLRGGAMQSASAVCSLATRRSHAAVVSPRYGAKMILCAIMPRRFFF